MLGLTLAAPAAGFYLFGAIRQWLTVTGRRPAARMWVLGATAMAALLHCLSLVHSVLSYDYLDLSFFQIGSLISLVITLLILFSSWRKPVENLLIALLPMAALILILANVVDKEALIPTLSVGVVSHIILSILAYSTFTIASVQAILLYLQHRSIRQHKTRGLLQALPPLQTMDVLLFEMIWLGMGLLSIAFIIAIPHVSDLLDQQLLHKVVLSVIGWLVYATLLIGRYRFGWRGVVASRFTLIGMAFLMLSYFGSRFVIEFILD